MGISGRPQTLGEAIREKLRADGVSEATGFEVVDNTGSRHVISTDDNPLLALPADNFRSIEPKPSASAAA